MRNTPGYPDMFRGVWINSSTKNPAILQLYEPANVYGEVNDHDYLPLSPEIMFLEKLPLSPKSDVWISKKKDLWSII